MSFLGFVQSLYEEASHERWGLLVFHSDRQWEDSCLFLGPLDRLATQKTKDSFAQHAHRILLVAHLLSVHALPIGGKSDLYCSIISRKLLTQI